MHDLRDAIDRAARAATFVAAATALCACSVGPPPASLPQVDVPSTWSKAAQQAFGADAASAATAESVDAARWWTRFGDRDLDRLVELALAQNLDVQTAVLRIAEARAQRDAAAGRELPSVDASTVAGRTRLSENGLVQHLGSAPSAGAAPQAPTFNVFQAGFDALWELDLFGKARRGVEAADAGVDAAEEGRRDAQVSLVAEVARTYFDLRGAERRQAIARADLETQLRLARLVTSRVRAGFDSAAAAAAQAAQVSAARSEATPIDQAVVQARSRIALLLALPPTSADELVGPSSTLPALPPRVPVGLPGDLLRRRPDIRRGEAELRGATARVGVATASLFPSVRLGGIAGLQSSHASTLFEWASRFFLGGAQVSLPIFEGGQLRAQLRIADVQQQQAVLAYRQAVLEAFHEVDDALVAYDFAQRRSADLRRQLEDAERSRTLALHRYQAGLGSFVDVLDAERTAHTTEQTVAQSAVDASTRLVALYKALGGGWAD